MGDTANNPGISDVKGILGQVTGVRNSRQELLEQAGRTKWQLGYVDLQGFAEMTKTTKAIAGRFAPRWNDSQS